MLPRSYSRAHRLHLNRRTNFSVHKREITSKIKEKKKKGECKVFANRYYYEASHGVVSLLSVCICLSLSLARFSSAHLFNLPSRRINRLVVIHRRERNFPIGRSSAHFFCVSFSLSLSRARFFLSLCLLQ